LVGTSSCNCKLIDIPQRAFTAVPESASMTGLAIIQIEVWSSTAKGRVGFDDIWSILQKNIPRNELLDLRNRLILLLLLLHPLGNANGDLLLLLGLGSALAAPTDELREKILNRSELHDLAFEIRSEAGDVTIASNALDLLVDELAGSFVALQLFFIFHTIIMAQGLGTFKKNLRNDPSASGASHRLSWSH